MPPDRRRPDAGGRPATHASRDTGVDVTQTQPSRISPEDLTAAVWQVVREVPGVVDLHRNPLQMLGERVKLDWHGPVRLLGDETAPVLEVHIVVAVGHPIPVVAEATQQALRRYVRHDLPSCRDVRLCVDDIVDPADPGDGEPGDGYHAGAQSGADD